MDQATREEIGRQAKRVLDWGRLRYLEEVTDLEVRISGLSKLDGGRPR